MSAFQIILPHASVDMIKLLVKHGALNFTKPSQGSLLRVLEFSASRKSSTILPKLFEATGDTFKKLINSHLDPSKMTTPLIAYINSSNQNNPSILMSLTCLLDMVLTQITLSTSIQLLPTTVFCSIVNVLSIDDATKCKICKMLVEASRSAGKSIYGVDCADQLPNGAYTDALMIALSQNSVLTANYLISVMSPCKNYECGRFNVSFSIETWTTR
jgi:hypothetical protein